MADDVYIGGLAVELGEPRPLADLKTNERAGVLAALADDGLREYRNSSVSRAALGARSFEKTLESWKGAPSEIDLILYCSESMSVQDQAGAEFHELCNARGLGKVPIVGLSLCTCANLVPALRFARSQIRSEGLRNVAIVAADKSAGDDRITRMDIAVMSDGASSCIVSSRPVGRSFRVRGVSHVADQLLRCLDYDAQRPRCLMLTASGVRKAKRDAFVDAAVSEDVARHMLCSTLRLSSVRFFAKQCHIELDDVFTGALASVSHVYSSDFIINLIESDGWRTERGLGIGAPFFALLMGPYTWGAVVMEQASL